MQKKILTEQALYYGDVSMPKGFEIDRDKLSGDILQSTFTDSEFPFSRTWDMLNTYMREHINPINRQFLYSILIQSIYEIHQTTLYYMV
jgi:hypothetical protein